MDPSWEWISMGFLWELCMGYRGMVSFYLCFFRFCRKLIGGLSALYRDFSVLYVYRFFSGFDDYIGILWELMLVFLGDNWDSN